MAVSTFGNRVQEDFTTTGTGTITLAGASSGFQTFSAGIASSGTAQVQYTLFDSATNDFEVGLGTYTATGTTLSRDTIFDSSNSGSAVNFAAGTKVAFVTLTANRFLARDEVTTGRSDYTLKDFSSEEGTKIGAIQVSDSAVIFDTETDKIIEFRPGGSSPRVDFYSDIEVQENSKLFLGSQSDLQIYHLLSTNYIDSTNVSDLFIRHGTTTRIEVDAGGVELYGSVRVDETQNLRPINIQAFFDSANISSSSSSLYSNRITYTPQRTDSYLNFIATATGRYLENSDDPGWYGRLYYLNSSGVDTVFPSQATDTFYFRGRFADRGSSNYVMGTPTTVAANPADSTGGYLTSSYLTSSNNVQIRVRLNGVGGTSTDDLDLYGFEIIVIESVTQ